MAGKKPGKYAHVIHDLPRTFGSDEESNQEQVDALKRSIVEDYQAEHNGSTPPASYLAREWADLRVAKEAIEEQLSEVNTQLSAYTQLMVNQYEAEGIEKLSLDTGEAPRVQYEPYASITDADAFREWCIAKGYKRSLTLPWQTRTSIAKEHLLAGEQMPPGLKIWNRPKIVKR